MKTLAQSCDALGIVERLQSVQRDDQPRWGRMNVHQMLRHLADSMRIPMGEIEVSDAEASHMQRAILKWAALYVPLRWRRNFPTRPEIDQCRLGVRLDDFEADHRRAVALLQQLCAADLEGKRHPYFGAMTRAEWLRWGWLHADHHLRQFGR